MVGKEGGFLIVWGRKRGKVGLDEEGGFLSMQ